MLFSVCCSLLTGRREKDHNSLYPGATWNSKDFKALWKHSKIEAHGLQMECYFKGRHSHQDCFSPNGYNFIDWDLAWVSQPVLTRWPETIREDDSVSIQVLDNEGFLMTINMFSGTQKLTGNQRSLWNTDVKWVKLDISISICAVIWSSRIAHVKCAVVI